MFNLLFIGDIVGRPGRRCVENVLPVLINKYEISFVVANGENAAGGVGITPAVFSELSEMGIGAVTSGNHIWDKKEIYSFLNQDNRLLRPANYSNRQVPGKGSSVYFAGGLKLAVLNLAGRVFMPNVDCPFQTAEREVTLLRKITSVIIVDFHAEATSEKKAMAYYLDGKVTALIGTHTHVQTADEQILPRETAFITDVGMTGPFNSILGVAQEPVIRQFTTSLPQKFSVAKGSVQFNAVLLKIEPEKGAVKDIVRINMVHES